MSLGSLVQLLLFPAVLSISPPMGQVLDTNLLMPLDAREGQQTVPALLSQSLADGEAHIWYLGHCGWAIKTRSRLLIFDYWEQHAPREERSLANGRINPEEIKDLDVFVFVSHDHGDHFDRVILDWAESNPNMTYVFGWDVGLGPGFEYLSDERERRSFDGMEVVTVNHDFDNIPEVAYLVKVDGLVLFHSGDHGSTTEVPNQTFTGNIDFFAEQQEYVDLAFISTFGRRGGFVVNNGDIYTIDKLRPRAVFPMHHGGGEDLNQRFVNEVAANAGTSALFAARRMGDRFFYSGGSIQRLR